METIAFGCWSRIANSERCLTPPSATARPPSLTSRGPSTRKSMGGPADSTAPRGAAPAPRSARRFTTPGVDDRDDHIQRASCACDFVRQLAVTPISCSTFLWRPAMARRQAGRAVRLAACPQLRRHVADWPGARDFGLVAVACDASRLGPAWARLFIEARASSRERGRGIGRRLDDHRHSRRPSRRCPYRLQAAVPSAHQPKRSQACRNGAGSSRRSFLLRSSKCR